MESSQPEGLVMDLVQKNDALDLPELESKLYNGDLQNSLEDCDESGPSNDKDSLLSKENSPPQLSPISPASNNTADNSENGTDTYAEEMSSTTMSKDKSVNQEDKGAIQKADHDSDNGDDGHINKAELTFSNAEHVLVETLLETDETCNKECIDDAIEHLRAAKNYTTSDKDVILKSPIVDDALGNTVPVKAEEVLAKADELVHVSNFDDTSKDLKADNSVIDSKDEKCSSEVTVSESVTEKTHTIPPQMFEDITEDEDSENEESFENIELELDDLIDPSDVSKNSEKEKAESLKGLEVKKTEVELITKSFQPEHFANIQGDNSVGFCKSLSSSPKQRIIDINIISETPRSSNTVIQVKSEKSSHEGNIYTILHSSDSKAVNGLGDGVHTKKPKVTARKSGRPESAPLKINLHPIKNITMTISDVEKALDYPSRDADALKLSKNTESCISKTNSVNTESSQSDGSSGLSALKALGGLKKKRRKNTYDFPGCKKKPKKFKSDELESVGSSADSFSLSDGDFPDSDINKEATPVDLETDDKTPISKTESALDILTKNAYLGFTKKPKSSTSPLSSSTTLSTSKATIGKSNKIKTVLEMLHERSRQKAESDEKSVTTTVSVTTSATTTTTTILVSPPPNKPILEGVKRKGTPRKRREEVICLSDSEDSGEKKNSLEGKRKRDSVDSITKIPSSTSSIQTYSPQTKSKPSPGTTQAPVVMVVAQHSVAPGLRSLLPRHAFVQAGAASSGKVLHPPAGSVLGTFPLISTLPVGAKAISLGNLPPGMTALPITSLSQGTTQTMTFFAPVPSAGTSVSSIPVSFPGASLIVTTQKQQNNTSLTKTIKSTSGSSPLVSPISSPAKASKSSEASPAHGNSDSLRALLVGKPYAFARVATTAASQLNQAPVLFQMVTSSGTSLVPITAQPLTLTSSTGAPKMLKPKSAASGVKSSYSVIKSHPSNVPNGVSCLTPPKTPDTDGASEVAVAASLSRPVAGQVEDSEVIPLCCCKINGASFNKLFSGVTYCQALDTVDNKVLGCCNKVTNSQLVRPGVKIPFMAVCEIHRKRLKLHQCCPGCGHFCSQGKFQQCRKEGKSSVHNFHKQCMFYRGGKYYCPHCGEETSQCEVELRLNEQKPEEGKAVPQRSTKREIERKTARISSKNFVKSRSTNEQPAELKIALSNNKTINFGALTLGPDHQSLTKLCRCTGEDRPKKYRTLPKDLYTPAMEGDLEKVFYLLLDGVDPNKRYEDQDGQTAMHAAAISGSLGTVFILEQFGAEIHAQDKTLRTPMMCAAENGNLSVVQFLIKSGAKVEDRGEDGMTSLHYAAKAGYIDIIQHILETGQLDINIQDDGGWTPIIWATESQLADVVRYLIKQGGDPNKKDNEENTGLHWAAFSGSLEIAEMFIDLGSEIDAINEHGDRPLHIAARQDHYDIVVLLLARGADVDTRNNKDETPVDCCVNKTGQVWMALKVNQQLRSFAARKLIQPERLVERDITMGREKNPIACVNSEDNELCPTDYLYVTENVETSPLNINYVITSLQSCRCKDDCSSMYCVCGRSSIKCWYDKMGRLLEEVNLLEPPLLFECNRACRCWVNCNNRVVQNGITCRLQMFRTNGRGWGVRTLMDIPKGTFVCEYIGELISDSEADRREDDSYLFDLDNKDGDTYCIDARKYGNISRFINHLCEPNLIPVKVFVEHQDLRFPRICLFSSKEIKAYEELGFDYGEKFWMIKWKHFTCACKSLKCKYSSETIKKTLADYKLRYPDQLVDV